MSYTPPSGTLTPTWSGVSPYRAPSVRVIGWWAGLGGNVFPVGQRLDVFGQAFVAHRFAGWDSLGVGHARITHEWEYRPPFSSIQAAWAEAQAYTAPHATIDAQWSHGADPGEAQYASPVGIESVAFGTLSVRMDLYANLAGWVSGAFGAAAVESYRTLHASWRGAASYSFPHVVAQGWWKGPDAPILFPAGMRATRWGAALVQNGGNYAQTIAPFGQRMTQWGDFTTQQTGEFLVVPAGRQHADYGQPTIYNLDQYLLAFNDGARYTAFGAHTAHIAEDQAAAPAGSEAMLFGAPFVAREIRWLEHGNAYAGPQMGASHISYRAKSISVPWTVFTQYGMATVGRNVELAAVGADSLQIPTSHLVKHDNVLEPAGFTTKDRWGSLWVSRSPRVLGHQQREESQSFGDAHAQLWVRYLQHDGFKWEHEGTKWGSFTHVFNRNRTITVPGLQSFRSQPLHLIENAARALAPYGIAPAGFGSGTFIADRVRFIGCTGIDSFRMSNFGNRIHNTASLLKPQGRDSLAMGTPEKVASNLQTVRQHSGSTPEFGDPFVADAVRAVAQWPSLNALHHFGVPWISNFEQYAAPGGIGAPSPGSPVLLGPFIRTLQPRWFVQTRHGTPTVRNKTPNVYAWGRPHTEFSDAAWVSFVRRPLAPAGIEPPNPGRPAVQFRTRTVRAVGSLMFGNSPWATQVKKAMPDPPSTRTVAAQGIGTIYPSSLVGSPIVRYNLVRPEGIDSLKAGRPLVSLQGAYVPTHYPSTEWGNPHIDYARRILAPSMIPADGDDLTEYGAPRLSPFTIWACPATPQAMQNNPGQPYIPIDEEFAAGYGSSRRPWFGQTTVSNGVRYLYPYHDSGTQASLNGRTRFGEQWARNKNALVQPYGIDSSRFDYPVLHPHTKTLWGVGLLSEGIGLHSLKKAHERAIPVGIEGAAFGEPFLIGGERPVHPAGFSATQWGNNAPMVHFPRRFSIGAYDATQWGAAWVSYRVRGVAPAGATMTEMDWTTLKDRMTVIERYRPAASGFDGLAVGRPAIANAQQFIRPYMIPPPCLRCNGAKVQHG